MLEPDGRVFMVTGAGRGIGLAVARCLHAKGYSLSLGARDLDALKPVAGDLGAERVMVHSYDATDLASNEDWVAATAAHYGRIDGLVNNAGILLPATIEDDDAAFDQMWAVNVKGPLRMIRLAMPHLKRAGSGRIVNVASLSGKRVRNDNAGYCMSKFAVMALTHAARRAGWASGVRVTALCPGYVATDMTADVDSFPAADMIRAEDLAELVATVVSLPNTASVPELPVNCQLEDTV